MKRWLSLMLCAALALGLLWAGTGLAEEGYRYFERSTPEENGISSEYILDMLDFIQEKYKTITLLLRNSNASSFLDKLHNLIYKYCLDYARERFQIRDEIQLNYFLSYVSFGIMGMVKEWTDVEMTLPKEKIISYADDLLNHSAQAIF